MMIKDNNEIHEQTSEQIIRASLEIDCAQWIAGRIKEMAEYEISSEEMLGDWPEEIEEKGSIGLHKDILTQKIKPEVYLGLAKIQKPWHLPAVVKYGGWNDCPNPEVHCAFHGHWSEKYGAEITGVSGDIIECRVTRPPTEREDAIALAWEQYWYCTDIVEQGCGTVANLAATLLNSPYWFFWWD